jgi:hypothetical protein
MQASNEVGRSATANGRAGGEMDRERIEIRDPQSVDLIPAVAPVSLAVKTPGDAAANQPWDEITRHWRQTAEQRLPNDVPTGLIHPARVEEDKIETLLARPAHQMAERLLLA